MISVIIPVYNAERYLRGCLDSVLRSVHRDFELVLVNDGSTDGSLQICEEYAARDSRIRLISQENRGASAARNRGMDVCRGEWVVFVDADDIISSNFLGLVVRDEYRSQDLLLFDFARSDTDLAERVPTPETLWFGQAQLLELLRSLLLRTQLMEGGNLNFVSPCGKAYRKSLLDRYAIRFDISLSYGEDKLFNTEYLSYITDCAYLPIPVYYYAYHQSSQSHRFDARRIHDFTKMLAEVRGVLETRGLLPPLKEDFVSCAQNILDFLLLRVVFSPINPHPYHEKCQLCQELRDTDVFRMVSEYRPSGGTPVQYWTGRMLLFFIRTQQSGLLCLEAQISHMLLALKNPKELEEMRNSGWFP